jgi:hypothetical protein
MATTTPSSTGQGKIQVDAIFPRKEINLDGLQVEQGAHSDTEKITIIRGIKSQTLPFKTYEDLTFATSLTVGAASIPKVTGHVLGKTNEFLLTQHLERKLEDTSLSGLIDANTSHHLYLHVPGKITLQSGVLKCLSFDSSMGSPYQLICWLGKRCNPRRKSMCIIQI